VAVLLDLVRADHLGSHQLADPRDGLLAACEEADAGRWRSDLGGRAEEDHARRMSGLLAAAEQVGMGRRRVVEMVHGVASSAKMVKSGAAVFMAPRRSATACDVVSPVGLL